MEVKVKKELKNYDLDINFSIADGCLGILGASGCGKSMTLKAIAGIVTPDSGQITIGEDVVYHSEQKVNMRPQDRKVGYLFQNYALFPNMTVEENIIAGMLGNQNKRQSKKKQREMADAYIRQFHLEKIKDEFPHRLSGGQQQRTALARMFASRPRVMLLDEPFSALDSYLREELQIELKERIRNFEGCTILVSHDRDEIYKLCDRTMVMENGKNIICEETEKLFQNPKYMVAARLTGCKNISRAKRVSDFMVYAIDWGETFCVDQKVPERLSYIGIRAHDFVPVVDVQQEQKNRMKVSAIHSVETPFERTILFQNKQNSKGSIWMKQEKSCKWIPDEVSVDPKKILLLEE